MQESKKPEVVNNELKKDLKKEEYYTTSSKKVVDFLIGSIGVIALALIGARFFLGYLFVIALITLVICVASFLNGRRFIGLGILIFGVAIPLILFGSCLVLLGAYSR